MQEKIKQCSMGVVFTRKVMDKWKDIVPEMFIHNTNFCEVVGHIIKRQELLLENKKTDINFAIILDGVSIKELNLEFEKASHLRIFILNAKSTEFKGMKFFSKHAWEISDYYCKKKN